MVVWLVGLTSPPAPLLSPPALPGSTELSRAVETLRQLCSAPPPEDSLPTPASPAAASGGEGHPGVRLQPRGLLNTGNSCFMNSTLQVPTGGPVCLPACLPTCLWSIADHNQSLTASHSVSFDFTPSVTQCHTISHSVSHHQPPCLTPSISVLYHQSLSLTPSVTQSHTISHSVSPISFTQSDIQSSAQHAMKHTHEIMKRTKRNETFTRISLSTSPPPAPPFRRP